MSLMVLIKKLWQFDDSDDRVRRVDECVDELKRSTEKATNALEEDARVSEEEVKANREVRSVIGELIRRIDAS